MKLITIVQWLFGGLYIMDWGHRFSSSVITSPVLPIADSYILCWRLLFRPGWCVYVAVVVCEFASLSVWLCERQGGGLTKSWNNCSQGFVLFLLFVFLKKGKTHKNITAHSQNCIWWDLTHVLTCVRSTPPSVHTTRRPTYWLPTVVAWRKWCTTSLGSNSIQ